MTPLHGVSREEPGNPSATAPYRLEIPGWVPTSVNKLMGWTRAAAMRGARLKRSDRETVGWWARYLRIPAAKGRRRISLEIRWGRSGRKPDPDNFLKSGLDALKHAGLIVDDSDKWSDWTRPTYAPGPRGTTITLDDIE